MNVLDTICAEKREHVARRKRARSLGEVERAARIAPPPRGFIGRLRAAVEGGGFGLIAEIKHASPSRGLIRADFDPAALARAYASGGATCLSVLTDEPFFQGCDAHLSEARAVVELPVLRKDFLLDPYQVVEARAIGADCALVILAAVDDGCAGELIATAAQFDLDVLVEVHNQAELQRALTLGARLIGINNRDLTTLAIDLATTERLAPMAPADRLLVSESGLSRAADLRRIARAGVSCFLVGDSLMRQADVEAATRALLAPTLPARP